MAAEAIAKVGCILLWYQGYGYCSFITTSDDDPVINLSITLRGLQRGEAMRGGNYAKSSISALASWMSGVLNPSVSYP
jgi:hypothetical protein